MKIGDIDWTNDKVYRCNNGRLWTTSDGDLFKHSGTSDVRDMTNEYSLREILEMEFELVVDWSKVAVDTRVSVSDGVVWHRGHFAKFEGDRVYTYSAGRTSWTRKGVDLIPWKYAKLVESEVDQSELERDSQL